MDDKQLIAALTSPPVRAMLRDAVSKGVLVALIFFGILSAVCAVALRGVN